MYMYMYIYVCVCVCVCVHVYICLIVSHPNNSACNDNNATIVCVNLFKNILMCHLFAINSSCRNRLKHKN